jgi:hypothetical protein
MLQSGATPMPLRVSPLAPDSVALDDQQLRVVVRKVGLGEAGDDAA